jgi:hypothetical protein
LIGDGTIGIRCRPEPAPGLLPRLRSPPNIDLLRAGAKLPSPRPGRERIDTAAGRRAWLPGAATGAAAHLPHTTGVINALSGRHSVAGGAIGRTARCSRRGSAAAASRRRRRSCRAEAGEALVLQLYGPPAAARSAPGARVACRRARHAQRPSQRRRRGNRPHSQVPPSQIFGGHLEPPAVVQISDWSGERRSRACYIVCWEG